MESSHPNRQISPRFAKRLLLQNPSGQEIQRRYGTFAQTPQRPIGQATWNQRGNKSILFNRSKQSLQRKEQYQP